MGACDRVACSSLDKCVRKESGKMPNAGEREAYVASRVREASEHPKALLLGAIGAMCSSPNESANVASNEALGLSIEEIQLARWVALFRKGKTREEFLLGLLEVFQSSKKQGEEAMEVKRGKGFFEIKAVPLLARFARDLFQQGVPFTSGGKTFEEAEHYLKPGSDIKYWKERGMFPNVTAKRLSGDDATFQTRAVCVSPELLRRSYSSAAEFVDYSGFRDLHITIDDRQAMKAAKAFARRWEKKSKELKGSREATVIIYQEFV